MGMPRCNVSHTGTANVLTARRLQGEKLNAMNRSKAKKQRKGGISFLGMRCCTTSQTHSHPGAALLEAHHYLTDGPRLVSSLLGRLEMEHSAFVSEHRITAQAQGRLQSVTEVI